MAGRLRARGPRPTQPRTLSGLRRVFQITPLRPAATTKQSAGLASRQVSRLPLLSLCARERRHLRGLPAEAEATCTPPPATGPLRGAAGTRRAGPRACDRRGSGESRGTSEGLSPRHPLRVTWVGVPRRPGASGLGTGDPQRVPLGRSRSQGPGARAQARPCWRLFPARAPHFASLLGSPHPVPVTSPRATCMYPNNAVPALGG